ncbi:Hypothetical protein D9617_16g013730 [Elsinoe fawcettii]|nr:Hypothetical protein D9617_16g013730 [Elsinoe fawcettii]
MSAKPQQKFAFITATCPDGFKSKSNITVMRSAVMHDYLDKAKDDPLTTDRRALKKRLMEVPRRLLSRTKSPQSMPAGEVRFVEQHPSQSPPSDLGSAYTFAATPLSIETPTLSDGGASAQSSEHSPQAPAYFSPGNHGCSTALYREVDDLGVEIERYFEDFHRAKGVSIPTPVEMEWLRLQCLKFFATKGKLEKWMPFQMASPLTYLSRLCVAAPYNDIMAAQESALDEVPYVDLRMTMEIFDVLPRMINDALDDPTERDSNSSIVAIIQLFYGQLSTPYLGMVGSHQHALKQMILSRGGLGQLEPNGTIAASLTMLNFEANFLRGLPTDEIYHVWTAGYVHCPQVFSCPSPDGPLFSANADLRCIASSPLCTPQTLEIINLARRMTLAVLRLRRLEIMWGATDLDVIGPSALEKRSAMSEIKKVRAALHEMPKSATGTPSEVAQSIYIATRAAALLYAHAVQNRTSLQQNSHCDVCTESSTAETIYEAVRLTSLGDCWQHLAGTLYWVLIVGAAACHPLQPKLHPRFDFEIAGTNREHRLVTLNSLLAPPSKEQESCNFFSRSPLVTPPDYKSIPAEAFQMERITLAAAKKLFDSYAYTGSANAYSGYSQVYIAEDHDDQDSAPQAKKTKPTRVENAVGAQERLAARNEYIRRYLTTNAMRVSMLLRFEHEASWVRSVAALAEVRAWLDGP